MLVSKVVTLGLWLIQSKNKNKKEKASHEIKIESVGKSEKVYNSTGLTELWLWVTIKLNSSDVSISHSMFDSGMGYVP